MNQPRALETLITGYLNQDWIDEYGDPWAAVEAFVEREQALARLLRDDIRTTIENLHADPDLETRLDSFALGYAATADGWPSYREWLLAVADRVDELLQSQGSEHAD